MLHKYERITLRPGFYSFRNKTSIVEVISRLERNGLPFRRNNNIIVMLKIKTD